jgi:hypothetical protein
MHTHTHAPCWLAAVEADALQVLRLLAAVVAAASASTSAAALLGAWVQRATKSPNVTPAQPHLRRDGHRPCS